DRGDWRSFRVDRVIGVPEPTGARFSPRALPAADAAEFVRRNISGVSSSPWRFEAVVDAPAAAVRERLGRWALVTEEEAAEDGTGRCLVTMTPDNLDWPV